VKVIFITAEPPWPLDQGDKLRNYHLLKSLASEHLVTLVCFCAPDEEDGSWRKTLEPFCEAIYTVPLSRIRMILNSFLHPGMPVTMAARASTRMAHLLHDITTRKEFDLVFACQLKMGAYLAKCHTVKRVLDLTDAVSIYHRRMLAYISFWPARLFRSLEVWRLVGWEKKMAESADLILLISSVDASFMSKIAPSSHVEVLSNGVDPHYFQPLPDSGKPVILFYGHLRYLPNADGITWFGYEIFPRVRALVPEAELFVIGKEPTPEIKEMATIPGVRLIGYVTDLRPYLAEATVVVAPLRFGTGIRNKILEAFCAGRSVVSTSLGCEGLKVIPGVHLEVADDPAQFAEKIICLIKNPALRRVLVANGKELVEQTYNWQTIGQVLNSLIKEL